MEEVDRVEYGIRPIPEETDKDPLFINAVARALEVLSSFHGAARPLTLNEIAERSGIGKSAVQRIVHTLRHQGYVVRDPADRGYLPGIRLLDHTLDYLRLNPLLGRILPTLMELRRDTGERVDFSLRDDLRLVYAVRLQSKRESYFASLIGNSVPLYCTAGGRAVLSAMAPDEAAAVVGRSRLKSFTGKTLTDPEAILKAVATAREQGYAMAVEEVVSGEVILGVAIRGDKGEPVGAIHIGGSLSEWQPEEFARSFAPLVMTAAEVFNKS